MCERRGRKVGRGEGREGNTAGFIADYKVQFLTLC